MLSESVVPETNDIAATRVLLLSPHMVAELTALLRNLDRPVECYVHATKGA